MTALSEPRTARAAGGASPMVLGAAVLAVLSAAIQAPGLMALGRSAELERRQRALHARLSIESVRVAAPTGRPGAAVPASGAAEPAGFLARLRGCARATGCRLEASREERSPVAGQPRLAAVDTTVRLAGTYSQLRGCLERLRNEPRVLAVTEARITPRRHPLLEARLVIRRYVRREEDAAPGTPALVPVAAGVETPQ